MVSNDECTSLQYCGIHYNCKKVYSNWPGRQNLFQLEQKEVEETRRRREK